MQYSIQVGLLLGADPVAAHFSMRDGFEIHGLDQLIHRQLIWQIRLVAQDQQRDPLQRRLAHQFMQFLGGGGEGRSIRRIDDKSIVLGEGSVSCRGMRERIGLTRLH